MSVAFTIRAARPEDADAVSAVRVAGWRATFAHLLSPGFLAALDAERDAPGWRRTIEASIAEPERLVFPVAEVDGLVLGFAIAGAPREDDPPRDWQLYLLYQDERMHGSGTGQALLEAAVGGRPAFLWSAEDNPRANAFYRRNGFLPDGARTEDQDFEGMVEVRLVR